MSFMTNNGANIIGDGHVIMARMQPSKKNDKTERHLNDRISMCKFCGLTKISMEQSLRKSPLVSDSTAFTMSCPYTVSK